ncbi:MAG: hypothetical protein HQ582_29160 [Planctomycetes bacterium]|nr:hypothetical protein [Planctomycetota bacterium]
MSRSRPVRSAVWVICLVTSFSVLWGVYSVAAKEILDERRARIESMDPSDKAAIERSRRKFADLDPAERQRLHQLHDKIEHHPRPDDLRGVMTQYCDWIKSLSPNQRDQLRTLDPAERIEKIKQLRKEQEERKKAGRFTRRGSPWGDRLREMTARERDGLIRWIDAYMSRPTPAAGLIDDLPESQREKLRQEWEKLGNDPTQRRKLFARVWVRWQLANPGEVPPLDDDALAKLRSELSSQTTEWLAPMPPDRQRRFLAGLIGAFLFIHNLEELSEYLENDLSGEERDWLTSLPPEQMRQHLWRLYIGSKFPGMSPRSRDGRPPWFRGPPGQSRHGPSGPPSRASQGGRPRGPQSGRSSPDGPPKDGPLKRFGERAERRP